MFHRTNKKCWKCGQDVAPRAAASNPANPTNKNDELLHGELLELLVLDRDRLAFVTRRGGDRIVADGGRTGHVSAREAVEHCVGGGAGLRRTIQVGAGDRDVERRRCRCQPGNRPPGWSSRWPGNSSCRYAARWLSSDRSPCPGSLS